MSGETEASVSGWTVDTLREHIGQRLDDLDRMLSRRMDDADKAISAALTASEKAVNKAENASEKRFEGVNEFRKALADQTGTFVPRSEQVSSMKGLEDRISANAERLAALELRLTRRLDLGEGQDTGTGRAQAQANVTGAAGQLDRIASAAAIRTNLTLIISGLALLVSVILGIVILARGH